MKIPQHAYNVGQMQVSVTGEARFVRIATLQAPTPFAAIGQAKARGIPAPVVELAGKESK